MTLARRGFAPGLHEIEAYGRGGFRFGGVSHVGSILVLPSGIHAWAPAQPAEISPGSLSLFADEVAKIDLAFIGTGPSLVALSAEARAFLTEIGLRHEVLPTSAAARTYNVLLREGRRVAGAFIAVA